jgi:hypothetical protein
MTQNRLRIITAHCTTRLSFVPLFALLVSRSTGFQIRPAKLTRVVARFVNHPAYEQVVT